MDKTEFAMIMSYLSAAYPNAAIPNSTIEVYYRHLQNIPYSTMERAAKRVVEVSKFFPTIAELKKEIDMAERIERVVLPDEVHRRLRLQARTKKEA